MSKISFGPGPSSFYQHVYFRIEDLCQFLPYAGQPTNVLQLLKDPAGNSKEITALMELWFKAPAKLAFYTKTEIMEMYEVIQKCKGLYQSQLNEKRSGLVEMDKLTALEWLVGSTLTEKIPFCLRRGYCCLAYKIGSLPGYSTYKKEFEVCRYHKLPKLNKRSKKWSLSNCRLHQPSLFSRSRKPYICKVFFAGISPYGFKEKGSLLVPCCFGVAHWSRVLAEQGGQLPDEISRFFS